MSNATEFKTACVLQNSIEELEDALKHEEALKEALKQNSDCQLPRPKGRSLQELG